MKQQTTYHYEGRFGLCPVLIDDLDSRVPTLEPKYPFTGWLMTLSEWYYVSKFCLGETLNPEYLPAWPIWVKRRLKVPIIREFEDES